MVYGPRKWAKVSRKLDENSLKHDRFNPLPADTNTTGWSAKKVAAVVGYLQKYVAEMADHEGAYITESRLVEIAEKAGRDYDRYMAKQALAKVKGIKKPKFR